MIIKEKRFWLDHLAAINLKNIHKSIKFILTFMKSTLVLEIYLGVPLPLRHVTKKTWVRSEFHQDNKQQRQQNLNIKICLLSHLFCCMSPWCMMRLKAAKNLEWHSSKEALHERYFIKENISLSFDFSFSPLSGGKKKKLLSTSTKIF